jgi:tetratricopeptide (TPR) repeat protein
VLLRPRRLTEEGRQAYENGNHPEALEAFEDAARARPSDPAVRFNMADGLYKNGKYDEAAALFRALGADPTAPLSPAARFNLGNSLYQKQDYPGAIQAYRDALRLAPGDEETRRNLELALRKLQEQQERERRQQEQQKEDQEQEQNKEQPKQNQEQDQQGQSPEQKSDEEKQREQQQQPPQQQQRPQTPEEREQQRFKEETGMPKERAMQLLDALQENEKAEQKRLLAEQRAKKRTGKDW